MEGELWERVYRLIKQEASKRSRQKRVRYCDAWILAVFFWAVVHDRPTRWACQAKNWPQDQRWRDLPSEARMSERLQTLSVLQLLTAVLERMNRNLARQLSVPELARMAAMSERTFLRRFRDATGVTPGEWLRMARLDRARQLLEGSSKSVESIAHECGFGTANTLRQHFRQRMGVCPTVYRVRFA